MEETNDDSFSFHIKKQPVRIKKYFVYHNKEYPVDYDLLKKNSNYFFNNQAKFENIQYIELINEDEEHIDISEESIQAFISSCQNEPCTIKKSTIIPLKYLACKFEFTELIEVIDKFINQHSNELIFPTLLFKISQADKDCEQNAFYNTSKEVKFISDHLKDFIQKEEMLSLPIPLLYKIFKLFYSNKQENNELTSDVTNFLFKCLDKYGKAASVLFNVIDFKEAKIEVVNRLFHNYSEIFDFNMINLTLTKTTMELTSELSKQKEDYSTLFLQMKQAFEEQYSKLIQMPKNETEKEIQNKLKKCEERIEQLEKYKAKETDRLETERLRYEDMTNKIIELEKKIENQNILLEKYEEKFKKQVKSITINSKTKTSSTFKTITFTAEIKPKDVLNKEIIWEINSEIPNSIETLEKNEDKLQIKVNKGNQKIKIKALNGNNDVFANKELFIGLLKCEINAKVEKDQVIKGTIKLFEEGLILNKTKSKYILDKNNLVLGENAYINGSPIESLTQDFSFLKSKGIYYLHALIVDNQNNSYEIISNPLSTDGASFIYDYTGSQQSVELEAGEYKLEVWGAQGGTSFYGYERQGGKGGYSTGTIRTDRKTKFYIYVGGQGVSKESSDRIDGGFNGGGYSADKETGYKKGVGGGATDIRINTDSLYSRVIVAGGGGGGGGGSGGPNPQASNGGVGGGENGGVGSKHLSEMANASSSTQISGGKPGKPSYTSHPLTSEGIQIATGRFGNGGSVSNEIENTRPGAGGGGWYGGGAGNSHGGSGSGGSGWVFTESNYNQWKAGNSSDSSKYVLDKIYYLKSAETISGDKKFPNTAGSGYEEGHEGNGYAKITLL